MAQELPDELRECLHRHLARCAVPQCGDECHLACRQPQAHALHGQLREVRGDGRFEAPPGRGGLRAPAGGDQARAGLHPAQQGARRDARHGQQPPEEARQDGGLDEAPGEAETALPLPVRPHAVALRHRGAAPRARLRHAADEACRHQGRAQQEDCDPRHERPRQVDALKDLARPHQAVLGRDRAG